MQEYKFFYLYTSNFITHMKIISTSKQNLIDFTSFKILHHTQLMLNYTPGSNLIKVHHIPHNISTIVWKNQAPPNFPCLPDNIFTIIHSNFINSLINCCSTNNNFFKFLIKLLLLVFKM